MTELFIDSNLLLLLVVGRSSRDIIAKHRRLRRYTAADYDTLLDYLDGVVVSGTDASNNRAFTRLGITDAALLEAITERTPLLTVDLDLYHEAQQRAPNSAVNFNYLRQL